MSTPIHPRQREFLTEIKKKLINLDTNYRFEDVCFSDEDIYNSGLSREYVVNKITYWLKLGEYKEGTLVCDIMNKILRDRACYAYEKDSSCLLGKSVLYIKIQHKFKPL